MDHNLTQVMKILILRIKIMINIKNLNQLKKQKLNQMLLILNKMGILFLIKIKKTKNLSYLITLNKKYKI
jgi:hypothetical protein